MSKEKEFIIPVEWSMYSTVVVRGVETLEEALAVVEEHINDIPLPSSENAEYIDDSYKITEDCNLEDAQAYHTRGVLLERDNGLKITRL